MSGMLAITPAGESINIRSSMSDLGMRGGLPN